MCAWTGRTRTFLGRAALAAAVPVCVGRGGSAWQAGTGAGSPAVRDHEDVTAHRDVEYPCKRYAVSRVAAVAVKHDDGRPPCRELGMRQRRRGGRRALTSADVSADVSAGVDAAGLAPAISLRWRRR